MLFVDGGNNRVGIGTSTTSALLTVEGTGSYQATTNTSGLTITGATALQNAGKLKLSGAGTNLDHIEIDNDGGNLVIGLERSAGAGIIGSGPSYAGVFGTVSDTPIVFGANNGAKASIGGTGEFRVAQLVSGNPGAGTDGFIVTPSNGILITSNGQLIRAYSTNSGTPVFSVTAAGAVSKASGSFRIKHPLSHLNATHNLVHSFVEAPEAANIYRGKIPLSGGSATINIDTISGMTDGTFEALNRDVQCFTSNETGWTAVKGSVSSQSYDFQLEDGSGSLIDESGNTLITEVTTGNILTITAQENSCTDTISWMVIGQRHDSHMYDTDWTNENGRGVVEPLQTAAAAYIPNS